jgi:hypothetical protein
MHFVSISIIGREPARFGRDGCETRLFADTNEQGYKNNQKTRKHTSIRGYRGDGPVFGVHVTERIPHLRAVCQYGVSVADEWMLIHKMLEFSGPPRSSTQRSTKTPTTGNNGVPVELAIECWDVDDGQVLLIESAVLCRIGSIVSDQSAVDTDVGSGRVGTAHCTNGHGRGSCGDRRPVHGGSSLTLEQSLAALVSLSGTSTPCAPAKLPPASRHLRVNLAIQATCQRVDQSTKWHTTALAVPRSVAWLVHSRPDLVAACQALRACQQSSDKEQQNQQHHVASRNNDAAAEALAGTCPWVWTTVQLGQTLLHAADGHGAGLELDTIPLSLQS